MTARILNMTPAEYAADKANGIPCLSQSTAHTLLSKSPIHAWDEHPRLGGHRRKSTGDMNEGTIIHKLLLGKGSSIAILEFDSFRSNAAKEARDAAISARQLPILVHKYAELGAAAEGLADNLKALGINLSGDSEVAFEWEEDGEHGPVLCRGMMDHVILDQGVIFDVKKTVSAHPKACSRSAGNYGYAIQAAAYTSALEKYRPDLAGRIDFIFLFCELESPYAIWPARPNGMMRELGKMQWTRAVRVWERCLASDVWPGYARVGDIGELEPTPWGMTEEMENE